MDFVHSKFGCRENTFFVDFVQSEIGNHTPSSRLQEHPQARGSRLKKNKFKKKINENSTTPKCLHHTRNIRYNHIG